MRLEVNGRPLEIDAATPDDTALLWVLRDHLGLRGAKYGCGIGRCGACTVQLDGAAVRSCITPLSAVGGRAIRTIEGLAEATPEDPVLAAWAAFSVPQCGYCQPGWIMAVAALRDAEPDLSADEAGSRLSNLCRCGTYPAIRRALSRLFPA